VVVIERVAHQLAAFAGPCGGLRDEVRVGGREMTDTSEVKACDTSFGSGLRELELRLVTVGEQLLADAIGTVLAQSLSRTE
jgi:hypothetical protein